MAHHKVIIDCDAGADDAHAIVIALTGGRLDIIAITTVGGNIGVSQVGVNVLKTLNHCGRLDIPVYTGCNCSLLGRPSCGDSYYGLDGLGDVDDLSQVDIGLLRKEHAVNALVRLVSENPGEITLLATGPLTNIAMAVLLESTFGKKLKACYIMGGNINGRGNITPGAEFNFYSDPESAYVVLEQLGCKPYIIPFEVCEDASLHREEYDSLFSGVGRNAKFIKAIYGKTYKPTMVPESKVHFYDEFAVAIVINANIATITEAAYATVELQGTITRGQLVVDWLNKWKKEPNIKIIKSVDKKLFKELLFNTVGL